MAFCFTVRKRQDSQQLSAQVNVFTPAYSLGSCALKRKMATKHDLNVLLIKVIIINYECAEKARLEFNQG
jgi:hypothetical protein